MGLFGTKKVFGLKQALKAEAIKPIPVDHATTTIAILESMDIPVTAGAEAAEKIAELKDSVREMEDGIRVAKAELGAVPVLFTTVIDGLKTDLKKLADAVREAVLGKVDRIEDARDAKITTLVEKIAATKAGATTKIVKAQDRGGAQIAKIEAKIKEKIAEAEAKNREELADLKNRIGDLEHDVFQTKVEIRTLEPIVTKWTLPKK